MSSRDRAKKSDGALTQLLRGGHNWADFARHALLAQGLDPQVFTAAQSGIVTYLEEVLRWGERVDLIAPSSLEEFVDLSIADAAAIFGYELHVRADEPPAHWLDVGSGGGAPGLPLALLLAGQKRLRRLTLVEPRDKRVAFLRNQIGMLGIESAEVMRSRSDVLEGAFADVAIARATLPPPEWLLEGARLARRVWVLLAREAAPVPPPGWSLHAEISYKWPLTGRDRRALCFGSGAPTPRAPGS